MSSTLQSAVTVMCVLALVACQGRIGTEARTPAEVVRRAARTELEAFRSERELRDFLTELGRSQQRLHGRSTGAAGAKLSCVPETCESLGASCGAHADGCGGTLNCGPCEAAAAPAPAAEASESITNVQHGGVDEGGIVKRAGNFLIVLRRGRLFSVKIAGGELAPVSAIDAFGPDSDPAGSWYDELLVSGRTLIVIGFSYARGGTEIGLFDLDAHGKLAYRATYQLRSTDYYSARNYASRLVGDDLVFYTPSALDVGARDRFASFPALRRWEPSARARDFERIVRARNVYRPILATDSLTLHTVTVCDLSRAELECESTTVIGPPGRVFYVSPGAVYVWVTEREQGSLVYRLPLDRSAPAALRARSGSPLDQFSFLEKDDHLNVLLREHAGGDGMWSSEHSAGDVRLLRVPLSSFSRHVDRAPSSRYAALPAPEGITLQNRFVGDHLLYGSGNGWDAPRRRPAGALFVHRYAGQSSTLRLELGHGVDRIEALDGDALVVGSSARDLHLTTLALGARPRLVQRTTRRNAAQGELRSHGFFYRADSARSGVLGLPIREAGAPGYEHLFSESASVLFLENRGLRLHELGRLRADPGAAQNDDCRASCVDWYGNARPLFVRGRIFALLGYEIVEGARRAGRLREKRRVSFAPSAHGG